MAKRIRYTENDLRQLAMLMLAEARGEGPIGMNMVGTVGVNRVNANCPPDFKGLYSIPSVVYQTIPGTSVYHFEPVQNGELFKMRPTAVDINRARNLANGRLDPRARWTLWFLNPSPGAKYRAPCPPTMPRAPKTKFSTSFKNHCFYVGVPGYCVQFYQ